jgi:hypothetical protein
MDPFVGVQSVLACKLTVAVLTKVNRFLAGVFIHVAF